jgi:uncharacterized protein (TIGR00296 family)
MEVLTEEEGKVALTLAREAIVHRVAEIPEKTLRLTPVFSEKRGVFVTLKEHGELRGCIGFPHPVMPLGDAIRDAAVAAALEDPRFPPVAKSEIPALEIEVTVLTVPQRLDCPPRARPGNVEIGKHGLIVRGMGSGGLLLPQVPVEWRWGPIEFLDHTCMKACLPAKAWRSEAVELFTFEGQIFSEHPEAHGTGKS